MTALIGLFKAFAEREKSKAASQAVDPTQLRVALGNLEGDKFRVGRLPVSPLHGHVLVTGSSKQHGCCLVVQYAHAAAFRYALLE